MDSITQAALGAAIGGIFAPANRRRTGLVAGAILGTVPDLDVFVDYGGAVENYTYHRGFSHSLLVLAPFSVLLWMMLRKWWAPVQEAPYRWLALVSLALITHPLIDAHTAYGTQLFWPLTIHPTSWATLFIIDPLFTLPLLVGVIMVAVRPLSLKTTRVLRSMLVVSALYVAWSWVAHGLVKNNVQSALADRGLEDAPVFLTPSPFNTLLWRIVVLTDEGYLEGFDSLLVDEGQMQFKAYISDKQALEEANGIWAVNRLRWFSRDFLKVKIENDRLLLADLRMGQEPYYAFTHVVASRSNPSWLPVTTELLPNNYERGVLVKVWNRIWSETPAPASSDRDRRTSYLQTCQYIPAARKQHTVPLTGILIVFDHEIFPGSIRDF